LLGSGLGLFLGRRLGLLLGCGCGLSGGFLGGFLGGFSFLLGWLLGRGAAELDTDDILANCDGVLLGDKELLDNTSFGGVDGDIDLRGACVSGCYVGKSLTAI
jgi:hypothetical protein